MSEFSQVTTIGLPQPKSWDDFEAGCLSTYRGGHHDQDEVEAFRHGMSTVFNLLRGEFPPAEQCKASLDLLAACESLVRLVDDFAAYYEIPANHPDAGLIGDASLAARAAVARAKGGAA